MQFKFEHSKNESRVHAIAECGTEFKDVVIFHDAASKNPGIEVPIPIGLLALKRIIRIFQKEDTGEGNTLPVYPFGS